MNKVIIPRREFLKKSALVSTALFFAVIPTNSFSFKKIVISNLVVMQLLMKQDL